VSNTVIKVENLSKMYHLGVIGYGTLREDLRSWWNLKRGKEDPNTKIGEKSRLGEHGEFWALRDINLEIQQGDRVGIIGRNGAGKSTLLKIMSRVTAPSSGNIKIKGRLASLLEVGTGFHGELTGRENIFLNGAILGMKRREIQRKLEEIVEFAGVSDFIDTPVKRYSSGMFVRLGFSVAAHLDADILVVDEVLAVGDAEFQKKALSKMEDVSEKSGKTVLFVSHQLGSVRALCNNGILLKDGKIELTGSMDDIIENYLMTYNLNSINSDIRSFPRPKGLLNSIQNIEFNKQLQDGILSLDMGEGFNTKVDFKIPQNHVNKINIVVNFKTNLGESLATFASYEVFGTDYIRGHQGSIFLDFDSLNLMPGSYYLTFALMSGEVLVDLLENFLRVEIQAYDLFNTGRLYNEKSGKVFLKPRIKVNIA